MRPRGITRGNDDCQERVRLRKKRFNEAAGYYPRKQPWAKLGLTINEVLQ